MITQLNLFIVLWIFIVDGWLRSKLVELIYKSAERDVYKKRDVFCGSGYVTVARLNCCHSSHLSRKRVHELHVFEKSSFYRIGAISDLENCF